jgi:hypothetical protein
MGYPGRGAAHRSSVLLFTCFLSATFARESFLHALLLARLQVKGVPLNLLDDVFLLHLAFETPQCVFEGLALLESYLRQMIAPPNWSPLDRIVIARFPPPSQVVCVDSAFAQRGRRPPRPLPTTSINQLQSELDLPRGAGLGDLQKTGRHPILGWEDVDSNALIGLDTLCELLVKPSGVISTRRLSRFRRLKDSAVSSIFR